MTTGAAYTTKFDLYADISLGSDMMCGSEGVPLSQLSLPGYFKEKRF
jgi:hypothetical protein